MSIPIEPIGSIPRSHELQTAMREFSEGLIGDGSQLEVSTHDTVAWVKTMNLRFVVTGGPGAGKTTLLHALARRGYRIVPESARHIIRKRTMSGLSPRPPLEQFGRDILQMDIDRYRQTPVAQAPVFFDRGIVDALAMLDQQRAMGSAATEAYIKQFPYHDMAFVMPPWQEIYKNDTERDQTFAEALQVYQTLNTWYAQWGYQLVEVPRAALDERVDFVLATVHFALTNQRRRSEEHRI